MVKVTPFLFLYFLIFGCFAVNKFYFQAKNETPEDNYAVVLTDASNVYKKNIHLDGNLNGKITVGEQRRADDFVRSDKFLDAIEFAKTLSLFDRRLGQGLSYEVALQAVGLTLEQKYELLNSKVSEAEKVNKINAMFSKK